MHSKRKAFLVPALLIVIFLTVGVGGYFVYSFLSASRETPLNPGPTPGLPEKVFPNPMDAGLDFFLDDVTGKFNQAKKHIIPSGIMNEISIEKNGRLWPASAWILGILYQRGLADDIPSGIPYTRIEAVELPPMDGGKAAVPFTVQWKDKRIVFPETPSSVKSLVAYQKDVGPIPLSVTFVWDRPALTDYQAWVSALSGFTPLVSRDSSGIESNLDNAGSVESFFFSPDGGKALLKGNSKHVVYSDVTLTTDTFRKLQDAIAGADIPFIPGKLPESLVLGDWAWRERGAIRPDYIKTSMTDGMVSLFSLYQWSSNRVQNDYLVYGLARTWNGFLSDLSLWFDRGKWDEVRRDIFKWFGMEGFNFSETNAPVSKNGLEMMLVNVDEKVVVVNIRDTKITELGTVFSDGWGEGLVIEVREDFRWRSSEAIQSVIQEKLEQTQTTVKAPSETQKGKEPVNPPAKNGKK